MKVTKSVQEIWGHIDTINREMGEVKTDITWIKVAIQNLNDKSDTQTKVMVGGFLAVIAASVFLKFIFGI